jgi:hypothetical protein
VLSFTQPSWSLLDATRARLTSYPDHAVDGASSTDSFGGARGRGEVEIVLATRTATRSGHLKLTD